MKNIWLWLKEFYKRIDGNKSNIGMALVTIINVPPIPSLMGVYYLPVLTLIGILTGVSIYDRVVIKKSFSKNYK